MKVGDKVVYGNFAGVLQQFVKGRCVIALAVPMKDGAKTVVAPPEKVEVVKPKASAKAKPKAQSVKAKPKASAKAKPSTSKKK